MTITEILIFSLIGGFFLNILPCVLSVIPLKILNFVKHGGDSVKRRLALAGLYSLGIIISFLVLGIICASALAMGHFLGFGFQMNSPWFNGSMAVLMAFLGLRLLGAGMTLRPYLKKSTESLKLAISGICSKSNKKPSNSPPLNGECLLEKDLSLVKSVKENTYSYVKMSFMDKMMGYFGEKLDKIRGKSVEWGSFFSGCLTTLLGSACTGPFLGYAMGMSTLMSPWATLGAFTCAGVGMAAPYVLLALVPGLIKKTPKSGKWVLWVERGCGTLMLLTAMWFGWLCFLV